METGETIKKGFLRLERDAQNIPGGFHCCAENPANGYPFAYVSDRFLEILGWEREEFAARFDNRYTVLIHPDDLAAGLRYRNAENSATYAKNGDSIFRLLGKNGYRWVTNAANRVEWHGSGYIVGTITDISPYVELRKKLEQHQRKIGVTQCQLPRKGELFCFCRSAPESDQPGEAFQAVPRSKKSRRTKSAAALRGVTSQPALRDDPPDTGQVDPTQQMLQYDQHGILLSDRPVQPNRPFSKNRSSLVKLPPPKRLSSGPRP